MTSERLHIVPEGTDKKFIREYDNTGWCDYPFDPTCHPIVGGCWTYALHIEKHIPEARFLRTCEGCKFFPQSEIYDPEYDGIS